MITGEFSLAAVSIVAFMEFVPMQFAAGRAKPLAFAKAKTSLTWGPVMTPGAKSLRGFVIRPIVASGAPQADKGRAPRPPLGSRATDAQHCRATMASPAVLRDTSGSDRVVAFFAGSDSNEPIDVGHPHFAVTDLAGAGCGDDRVDDVVDLGVVGDDVQADLRDEVDLVLGSAVG